MDIKEAKAKLADVSRSTGTKNPKTLVCELCVVIGFLLDEIDRIKTRDVKITKSPSVQPPWPDQPKGPQFPSPTPGVLPPLRRRGSAGDAE